MKKIPTLIVAFAFAAFVFAVPLASRTEAMQNRQNIVQVAVANGNFTTLAAALTCTDLAGILQVRWLHFTVFAPTDAAFAKLNLNKDNVCSSFSRRELRNILLFHVNLGAKDASVVLARKGLWMLNGQFAAVNASVPSIANAKIVATDVRASNGIIHVLDDVMLPR